jgi:hypothetical protein
MGVYSLANLALYCCSISSAILTIAIKIAIFYNTSQVRRYAGPLQPGQGSGFTGNAVKSWLVLGSLDKKTVYSQWTLTRH